MSVAAAQTIVALIGLYALAGVTFALCFLPRAAARMDPALAGSRWPVRALILPGVAAFWPLFALRWLTGSSLPTERNPHRSKATRP